MEEVSFYETLYTNMKMTKEEYRSFIAKYKLLGDIEQERKKEESLSLIFLDDILNITGDKIPASYRKSKLHSKIMVRKTLNKLPPNAFDQI